jgi:hypothetical protein
MIFFFQDIINQPVERRVLHPSAENLIEQVIDASIAKD